MWWLVFPGLIVVFLALLTIRALRFTPRKNERPVPTPVEADAEHAYESLSRMVQCRTVSSYDKSREDDAEFLKFHELLKERYPLLHATCPPAHIGRRGLLFHWKGKSSAAPCVYMSHYDVVPAEESAWQKPPFSGLRENDEIWGRGTLDTKCTLCAALESAETLLQQGFVPENDVYFSFAGDEEVAGTAAPDIVEYLHARNITPALVVDEGGAVVSGIFPGLAGECALIGTGEKGMLNLELKVTSKGGHASAPPPHTPVGVLASAVAKVENKPFPRQMPRPTAEMFDTLGRYSSFAYRLLFANLWCFGGILDALAKAKGGELNALMRTTCAFTMMQGSSAPNVIPPSATVGANLRLLGTETMDSAVEYIRNAIRDNSVELNVMHGMNPSPHSRTDTEGWARLKRAVEETWPDAIVSPYMMFACSDSRHYCRISENVFRFSAMRLSADDRRRIHGNDERISEAQLKEALGFYMRILQKS